MTAAVETLPLPIEPPHLVTHSSILWHVEDYDLMSGEVVIDVSVRRYGSEGSARIYVDERGDGEEGYRPLMRLSQDNARLLIEALSKAILEARVQDTIPLPTDKN